MQEQKLFNPKNKQLDTDIKLKVCTKQLYTTNLVRYLGILIDDKLILIRVLKLKKYFFKTHER